MEIIILLTSWAIAFLLGPSILPVLRKLKFGQTVRDDGPESHLQKNGTPTMGGIIFMLAIIISSILGMILFKGISTEILFSLAFMLLFGLVGFIDDYIKVVKKRSLGLKAKQKIALQLIFALGLSIIQLKTSALGSSLIVPFTDTTLDLGIMYVPFLVFVIIAIVNSVNLTDGLDGLASSVTVIVSICFVIIAKMLNNTGVEIFLMTVAGGCLGFLRVNKYPAKVFMGDIGSMALGGAVAAAVVILNLELIVPIICFVYFMESVSVIIQVGYFKKTQKRIFKMAPIHHHFELSGWHET
ncbi:MAG: phospho-N-acetylmuramoyl-pentapeptide-transferase, partial [Proteocatella sp.]